MAGFGGAIKLTGESEYRNALKLITQNLKTLSSEMKVVSTQYASSDKSVQALVERQKALESILEKQKATLQQVTNTYTTFSQKVKEQTTAHQQLEKEYKDAVTELERIKQQSGETSQEYKEQAEKVAVLSQKVQASTKAENENVIALGKLEAKMNDAQAEVNKTTKELNGYDTSLEEAKKAGEQATDGFTVMKGALANLVADGIRRAVQAMKELAKSVVETGATFDSTMSEVEAISGASAEQMESLTEKAKYMGETTKFTASEAGDALKYMAMAGWKTEDMLEGLEGIMYLASASGEDLGTTSDIVTDALTAMGYSAGEAGRLADVMASASSNANTNVALMGETFQYCAPIVGALGYNMEDTAVAIGLMANAGIKGTRAGTALRSILTNLSAPPKECATAMKELGISLTDSEGNMKSLDEVIRELRTAFSGLDEVERTTYANMIAGKTAMTGLLAIVGAGEDDFNRLTLAVNNSSGSAERMAKTMQDNVSGQFTILKSQIEGIYLTVYQKLEPSLRRAMTNIAKALREVNWEDFGRSAGKALSAVVDAFTWILTNGKTLVGIVTGLISAFAVSKILSFASSITSLVSGLITAYTATGSLTGALKVMNLTLLSNPVVAVASALAGLGVALYVVSQRTSEAEEQMEEYNRMLEDQQADIQTNVDAWSELEEARQNSVNAGMTELSHYSALYDELTDLVDVNGKVKEGYEGRASFIVSTLRDALGIEISMVNGVIQGYDELTDSIGKAIEKKRAQIILDSQESQYAEAIQKQNEGLLTLATITDELNKKKAEQLSLEKEVSDLKGQYIDLAIDGNELEAESIRKVWVAKSEQLRQIREQTETIQANYDEQESLLEQYAYTIGQYEKNMALAHEGEYEKMSTVSWEYVKDQENVGDAEKQNLENQVKATQINLDILKQLKKQTNSDIYDDQIRAGEKLLTEQQNELLAYQTTTQTGLADVEKKWSDSLSTQLSTITGKNVEFKNAGKGTMQMYVDGVAQGEPMTKKEMVNMAQTSINTLNGYNSQFNTVGKNYAVGLGTGVSNGAWTVVNTVKNLAKSMISTLQNTLQIQSPSKVAKKIGAFFVEGFGIGVKDEQDGVLKQIDDFANEAISSLSDNIRAGMDTAQQIQSVPVNTSIKGARYERANDPDLIGAFKEALSQMKIVLDDEVAGAFIDKTVTNIIYT